MDHLTRDWPSYDEKVASLTKPQFPAGLDLYAAAERGKALQRAEVRRVFAAGFKALASILHPQIDGTAGVKVP